MQLQICACRRSSVYYLLDYMDLSETCVLPQCIKWVPNPTTTSKLKPHYLLPLSVLDKPRIPLKISDSYRSGHSINEIAKQLRKSREVVRGHLVRAGILSRVEKISTLPVRPVNRGKVRWNSPYGFKYAQGRGIKHPQEFETLLILFKLRDAGLNAREIADTLNEQKLRPRSAKRWDRCTVHRIVEWHDKHPNFLQEVLSWTSNNSFK